MIQSKGAIEGGGGKPILCAKEALACLDTKENRTSVGEGSREKQNRTESGIAKPSVCFYGVGRENGGKTEKRKIVTNQHEKKQNKEEQPFTGNENSSVNN